MTFIERKLRRRSTRREKLESILWNVEDCLRNGSLSSQKDMAISLERIEFLFRQFQKLDEDIYMGTANNLVQVETSDEAAFNDRVVQVMAELRFRSQEQLSGESRILHLRTSQPLTGTLAM